MRRYALGSLFLVGFLFGSQSLWAQSDTEKASLDKLRGAPIFFASAQSILDFKADFEKSGAKLGRELVGVEAKPVTDEAEVNVYELTSSGLVDNAFDCHYHFDSSGKVEDAHCPRGGRTEPRQYVAAAGSLSTDLFLEGLVGLSELFKKIGPVNSISSLKVWRSKVGSEINMQASITWKNGSSNQTNHMHCHEHKHGNEIEFDCHRQREAGPFQPTAASK